MGYLPHGLNISLFSSLPSAAEPLPQVLEQLECLLIALLSQCKPVAQRTKGTFHPAGLGFDRIPIIHDPSGPLLGTRALWLSRQ